MSQRAAERHGTAWSWVEPWIAARFGESLTALKYSRTWLKLREYLSVKGIDSLGSITRETCFEYFLWRTDVARNTAYAELRVLSSILREATLRGIVTANPATQLGIKRQPPAKVKPEYTPALLDEIEAATLREHGPRKDFYRISFLISRFHGVRIAETRFPLHWVNFDTDTIRFLVKGEKEHVVPLHPKLRPHLLKLVEAGYAWTFTKPTDPQHMSALWCKFFIRHGFRDRVPHCCFHAFRVTTISRLLRAKIPPDQAKRYVAHSDTETHRLYQRIRMDDLQDCLTALVSLMPPILLWV